MSIRAYLQAVLYKVRDEEGKIVCGNITEGPFRVDTPMG